MFAVVKIAGQQFKVSKDQTLYVPRLEGKAGDKVEAEMKFGYSVNTHGIGDLVKIIEEVSDKEIDSLVKQYAESYTLVTSLLKGGKQHGSLGLILCAPGSHLTRHAPRRISRSSSDTAS